jgi:hypothetical protein
VIMLPHSVAGILERIPIISRSIEHQVRRSCRPSILPDEAEQERPNQNQPREHGATEEADRVPSIGNWRNQAISQATPKRYTRLRNLRYGDITPVTARRSAPMGFTYGVISQTTPQPLPFRPQLRSPPYSVVP